MKRILGVILGLLIVSTAVVADEKGDAEALLKNKIDAAIEVLKKKETDIQVKNKKILEIVSPIFDFPLMSKLALGREFWPGLSEAEKEKYTVLFTERLKASYLQKLSLYTDEEVAYKIPARDGRKVQIPTELISKGEIIFMLYKMYETKQGWKIYDVEIQGVSIISTFRSEFKETLTNGTIDDLLLKLEKPENNS
jgi:phospholipid transport system substrate-binding protein